MRLPLRGLLTLGPLLVASIAAAGSDPQASFTALNREATLEVAGKPSAAMKGQAVPEGASVVTNAGNTALVALTTGAVVEIEQRTRATFERISSGPDGIRIHLYRGTVRLDAAKTASQAAVTVLTSQARVTFRRQKGYVTSSSDQDVVTCLRCNIERQSDCHQNDYSVSDASTCLRLDSASVAVVTRQHGIELQSSTMTAMLHAVVGQLQGTEVAANDAPLTGTSGQGAPKIDKSAVALANVGEKATLNAEGSGGQGNIWWATNDPKVAVVDDVDPAGSCHLHATGAGTTAIVAFDQLGRYSAVPVDVRATAAR